PHYNPEEIAGACSTMARGGADALITLDIRSSIAHPTDRRFGVAAASADRIHGSIVFRVWGLMSYGARFADLFRRAATYVDRIPSSSQPSSLVINSKTAKALGLTIPPSMLARADEVIE